MVSLGIITNAMLLLGGGMVLFATSLIVMFGG